MQDGARSYRAVLFDLDDTLLDRKASFKRFARLFYEREPALGASSTFEEVYAKLLELDGWGDAPKDVLFLRTRQIWPGIIATVEELFDFFWTELIASMRPIEGAIEFAAGLGEAGVPWGVVTNGDERQYEKIRVAGIEGVVPFVIASKIFGVDKPDTRIYRAALEPLGTDAAETLFVGDNPYTDIAGAQQAGLGSAWLAYGRQWPVELPEPDRVIDHVSEVGPLLNYR